MRSPNTGSALPRKIQVMASDGWIYDVMGENAKLFEKETGIQISFMIYAPHVYFRALQTMLASGEAADIFLMQSTRWYLGGEIDPQKCCLDLTNEEWVKRLKPEWLPAVSQKGRVYGLIVWDDTLGWVYTYNDRIFRKLGLHAPRTTSEFMAVCERIKRAGIVPIYEPGASRWHTSLTFFEMGSAFEERDPGLYDGLNANRLTFAGYAPFRRALDQILLAVNRGFFGSDFMANTIEGSKTALISGAAAMTLNKIGFARSVLKKNPDSGAESWGMFPIPWLDNRSVSIERSAPTWFGNARSRDPAAVLEFFRFLTREDNLYRYAVAQPEGTSLSFPTRPVPLLPNEQSFLASARLGGEPFQGGVKYIMGQWMEIEADFEQMMVGAMSPQRFLAGVDGRRANMAAAARDPAWLPSRAGSSSP
ncbi:MAG TPA: ABC transporter substrate-binding protein [Spirochaetia bacterium]|nr:ABC transporter substrate-binding protein [Spirochaetia bacterium]